MQRADRRPARRPSAHRSATRDALRSISFSRSSFGVRASCGDWMAMATCRAIFGGDEGRQHPEDEAHRVWPQAVELDPDDVAQPQRAEDEDEDEAKSTRFSLETTCA